MTESPTAVFYGSAKAEAAPPLKQESKIVRGVKNAVGKWLDRIGPKNVEKHFIKAHERVLATLNSDQRKEVFAKEVVKWQKQGKVLGITATVIDAALAGLGGYFAFRGWTNLSGAADIYTHGANWIARNTNNIPVLNQLPRLLQLPYDSVARSHASAPDFDVKIDALNFSEERAQQVGSVMSAIPTIGSLGILITSGPGHWLAHLAAGGKEQFGKMKAKSINKLDAVAAKRSR